MGTSANVLVGATGKIYGAPTGTTQPTNATASLNAAYDDLGFVTEDGVSQTIGSDTTELKAWGGTTVRKMQTSHTLEYGLALMETNPDSLAAYYGAANVDEVLNSVQIKAGGAARQSWVIDVVDGTSLIRVRIPDGEVTDRGDIVYKTDEAIVYPITITSYPDSSDVKAYIYYSTPAIS